MGTPVNAPDASGTNDLKPLRDDQLIAVYRKLREKRDAAKKEFTEKQRPALNLMDRIENELLGRLIERGAKNVSCPTGTAFMKTDTTFKVEDWDAFLPWAMENEEFGMFMRNVAKDAVTEYVESHDGQLPPGLSMKKDTYVNINSPRGKGA